MVDWRRPVVCNGWDKRACASGAPARSVATPIDVLLVAYDRSCYLTPSTPARHIEEAADGGYVTLYTAGVVLSTNDHKDHAAREQSSWWHSVMAGVRSGHSGVELEALTAALITMCRYAPLQDRNNTPDHQDQGKITRTRSELKPERCWTTPQRVNAPLMWLAGVEGVAVVDGVK